MKKIILLFLIFYSFSVLSQNFGKEWKQVIKYEIDGQTQSASKVVGQIYKQAKRKNNDIQIIKCFFYQSKFLQVFDENSQQKIIENIRLEIKKTSQPTAAILNYLYGVMLLQYQNKNYYTISKITTIEKQTSKDFYTWSNADFDKEIENAYLNSLENKNELRKITLHDYREIFEISPYTDSRNISLYEYIFNKITDHLKSKIRYGYYSDEQWITNGLLNGLCGNSAEFLALDTKILSDKNLVILINLLQENEAYFLKNNKSKVDFERYKRIKYTYDLSQNKTLYINSLKQLEITVTNDYLKQQIKADRALHYYSITEKNAENNYYKDVLKLIDTIFQSKSNLNVLADAETIRNEILKKTLRLTIKKICYPNENLRAHLTFKNIDSIRISYYRLPVKYNKLLNQYSKEVNSDSLVLKFVKNNKPVQSFSRQLPNKNDYLNYSTEILLEKMEVGNYLVFIETINKKNKISFLYENVVSTRFNYIQDEEGDNDTFHAVDRKSGAPIVNALVKNNETSATTGTLGKINFPKKVWVQGVLSHSDLYFIKENDTLFTGYSKGLIYKDNQPEPTIFEAKAMLYFDRGIYRPGQKVFYKGIMMQKKDNEKNVVPFVTVHVLIEDSENTALKEYDTQTNEFGSFSGEFEIPKNSLTGEFTITIEEADDYKADSEYYDSKKEEHAFWDNVDYNDASYTFQVEEYKRPTFEIQFDQIKESYTLGDTVKLTGNAKTLAGSNLTNVTVAYVISNNNSYNDDGDDNYINTTTQTDLNGNFSIEFVAKKEENLNEINPLRFIIKATVTDTNGETRTANKTFVVGKQTLKLTTQLNNILYIEDKNELTINATTLNDYPINAKGEIIFYATETKDFLLPRTFSIPEIQTIPRETFHKLFPFEAYDKDDYIVTEKLIQKLDFNTESQKKLALSDIKKWNLGRYKMTISATDSNNNIITNEESFEVASKSKIASQKEIFTSKDTSKPNSEYIEISFYSLIPDLFITSRIYDDKLLVGEEGIQLKKGVGSLKIKKNASYKNDINFHFSAFWENNYAQKNYSISKEYIETKLAIEIVSLRSKIEPGSLENWSFKIKDNKQQAEFLASMYDSSLDQFKTGTWRDINFNNHNYPRYPVYYNTNQLHLDFDDLNTLSKFYKEYIKNPEIYWFGFDFNNPKNKYANKKYLEKVAFIATIPSNAKKITGIVTDVSGPLPGANVFVQGTNRGTQTDLDGFFEIDAEKNEILVFSFIGLSDKSVKVDAKNIKVKLDEEGISLQEVIVEGYGKTVTKSKTLGATQTISAETIEGSPNLNIVEELQAQLAGTNIGMSYADTVKTQVIIRGVGTLSADNEPLYVIDGVPLTEAFFRNLNINDIETVSVLKNASATAMYGNRGANGVIIISTKSALKELTQVKTRANFNETAFFYPNLTCDKAGKINFSFTAPESLTRWNLRLYAHNKKAETGQFQADIISQKEVMVMPNMPRFVREKDTINISAKVVNMTNEPKSGIAILMLYDAASGKTIDSIALNNSNSRNFNCKPKASIALNWLIYIPENLEGLQYKIVAKSGNFSDGEENILPVMANKILLSESIPLWVKGNTKKEYIFENFKDASSTLQHHSLTLEYTSNPVWLAIQSLPYLMEYEHECAEQTFARYYANCIATEILNRNPKVADVFASWRNQSSAKSKLNMNDELKSVVLAETPWLLDAQNEEEKNKRIALLFDLATLKESSDKTLKMLEEKVLPSGGFPWFDGGLENNFISQHILSGIGHLCKLFPATSTKYEWIVSKGIPNIDARFIAFNTTKNKVISTNYTDLHYLYTRSFYLEKYPLSKKMDSIISLQIKNLKKNWLNSSLYEKGMLALVMNRFNEKDFAKKITIHLKQTAANNVDNGMYWVENSEGYYWYQSAIETQALLIEAFSEIENDRESIDAMKVWLLKKKQSKNWPTTKATTEAIYALLLQGNDWLSVKDNTKIKIGDEKILTKKLSSQEKEANTGYIKLVWNAAEMDSKMHSISVENKSDVPGFGGVYWQYFENLENIKTDSTSTLSLRKEVYKKTQTSDGEKLIRLTDKKIKVGDLLTIRLIIRTENNLEFIHLKDLRASCFEPVNVISKYNWVNNAGYYMSTKDVATHFFFDNVPKGTYVLDYDVRVNNSGSFNDGIATIQSMYAPEFAAHSKSAKIVSEN